MSGKESPEIALNDGESESTALRCSAYGACCGTGKRSLLPFLLVMLLVVGATYAYMYSGEETKGAELVSERIAQAAAGMNGFDISNATIPESEILRGGPPKDGIPAILTPRFVRTTSVDYLGDGDLVVGFVQDDIARAYPLRILVWHEIVNDTIGELPVAVTYCPLCGTCMVFDRRVNGRELTFGVSGLLYNSDVLMYDHQTESLWSQLKGASVSGEHVESPLQWLPSLHMTWKAWKSRYPDSEVLSTNTGFGRNYQREAYQGYEDLDGTIFPVPRHRDDLPLKTWVVGVIVGGQAKAYSRESLAELGGEVLRDTVGDAQILIHYDAESRFAEVKDAAGVAIPNVSVYWFAWQGFYPDTALYTGKAKSTGI
jgi:hypothetical protein